MQQLYFWKKTPFFRLLLSLIIGIIIQWYGQVSPETWYILLALSLLALIGFQSRALFTRYRLNFLSGFLFLLPFTVIGALLVWHHDIRHSKNWIGYVHKDNAGFVAVLEETPVEKTKSFKANASVTHLIENEKTIPVKGKIILYFKNDSLLPPLEYGSQIIFNKSLQEIKNAGNPGSFDYKRYALFQGITHQVYLQPGEFVTLQETDKKWLPALLETSREKVVKILRVNIKGEKETGLAQALMIGYKDELDKTLVQSYTNTGVIHIIAISGLHLGLIYWLLVQFFKPIQRWRYITWLRPLLIICGLWLFSLLAGAQPSILRSAVMFSCLVVGENLTKRTSIINTLSLSAFLLLCYNPYWIWDTGFQLSYSAVLSIVIFMQPVYNLFYIKNKIVDFLWKLNAVTIAAQILTLPLSIYHFHQFPTLFLITNFVAVPLSSGILLGEIFLCLVSFFPSFALLVGKFLSWQIGLMNSYIEKIDTIPFSLLDALQINLAQAILLFLFITGVSYWLLEKTKTGLITGLVALSAFFILRSFSFLQASQQQKIIVYNVPKQPAIEFIDGRHFIFAGEPGLLKNDFVRNFHLKPSHILQRVSQTYSLQNLSRDRYCISFVNKNILLADSSIFARAMPAKHPVDLLVISKNTNLYIPGLHESFVIKKIVFDGTIPGWKLRNWKRDCDSLHIPYHDVTEKGAFVMNLN